MCFSMNIYKFVHFDNSETRVISAQIVSFCSKIVKLVSKSIIIGFIGYADSEYDNVNNIR